MESFADKVKKLRKEKGVPLRVVAARLDIDQAILSKIENGKRSATRDNVIRLAKYYKVNKEELLISWLSDKLLYEVGDERFGLKAMKVAEEKITYRTRPSISREKTIRIIRDFLRKDGRVSKAWIFGSFARGDYNINSDIDLMVKFIDPSKTSLFDYADIAYLLEEKLNMKIDLVEEGYLLPFALNTAKNDLTLIYG
ncbi:MAG: nucleotidyltransferase domain-containing protein [Bacteroidales bacterium]|jgi:predicted nucleotidyltransferase|nr:nucleotidyltransferase domain-containing protein [Bacteroidales bacterium]